MTGRICYCSSRSLPLRWSRKPKNQFNIEGGYAFFSYEVKGAGCKRYKWYNPLGELIPGERAPVLEISPITRASFGRYRIEVTNCLNQQLNAEVFLYREKRVIDSPYKDIERTNPYEVIPDISFFHQPTDITVPLGGRAELKVSVEGGTAPKFQWFCYKEDVDIPIHGQTKHKLLIEEVQDYNYGMFYVKVIDLFGQEMSSIPVKIQQNSIECNA